MFLRVALGMVMRILLGQVDAHAHQLASAGRCFKTDEICGFHHLEEIPTRR